MAISISEPVAETADTSNTNTYTLGAFTPTANALLVVFAFATGTVAAATMTGGGMQWFRVASQLFNTTDTAYVFVAQAPASPSSTTVTFDCTGDNATGCILMAFQVTGHNPFVPIKQVVTGANAGSANPALTVGTMNTNNGYCAGFGMPRNPPTSAPPTSWTEIADIGVNLPAQGGTGAFRAGGETGTTVTFTSSSAAWGAVFIEIWEATLGPQPASPSGEMGFFGV